MDLHGHSLAVSGFPRSGTSMMMRLLMLGGVEVITSERNKESVNPVDPHGILELDNSKEILEQPVTWTANRVIKIVSPYIHHLMQPNRPWKVIFMLRDVTEIVASLLVQRTVWEDSPYESVDNALRYLKYHSIPTLRLKYKEVMTYPKTAVMQIEDFLEVELDTNNAIKAVEKKPRDREEAAEIMSRVVRVDSEAYFQSKEDIIVLNDPNIQLTPIEETQSGQDQGSCSCGSDGDCDRQCCKDV